MVPILFHSTTRTDIRPAGQRHLLPMATEGTGLACIGRIHLPVLPTSICSFVREKEEKLRPRHVTDASVPASVGVHFVDRNILNKDPSVLIHDLRRFLVGKVGALVRNTLMNFCHDLFGFYSFRRSFLLKSQFPLGLRQPFGGAFQELRVFDGRPIGKRGKGFDPHIDPHRERIRRKNRLRNILAGKRHPPFSGGRSKNSAGLDLSFDRAMENDGNGPDLREALSRQIASAIPLGKGQGRVLPLSLEPGIAGVFTVFDPAKKRLERQIDANRHILKRLGIDRLKSGTDLFQGGERPDLGIQGQTGTVPVPRISPMLQKMVVEPAALFQLSIQKSFLFAGRIQPILECFSHVVNFLTKLHNESRDIHPPLGKERLRGGMLP